jgi:O-antigen/teichoic acid export membrane protein
MTTPTWSDGDPSQVSLTTNATELGRSFRRGFATLFAVDLVNKALTAATVVVLIRGLSVSAYAYVTVLLTLAQFTGSAAGGGVQTQYLREESERVSRGGETGRDALFPDALTKTLVLITVFGVCTFPLVRLFSFGSSLDATVRLAFFSTLFAAGYAATDLSIARFQARRRFLKAGVLSVTRASALLFGALVVIASSEDQFVVGGFLAGSTIVVGVLTAGLITGRALLAQDSRPRLLPFRREDAWLLLYSFAAGGFAYVDVLVAGALLSHYEIATLGAALRYWAVVLSAIPALAAVLRVRTSQVDIVDSPVNQRIFVFSWVRRASVPAALLVGLAALLAPVAIPQIDGGKYPTSIGAFQILLVSAFVAYATAPGAITLLAQRRYRTLGLTYGAGLALNLFGDIAVARPFGVIGIALVSSATYLAVGVAVTVQSVRYAARRGNGSAEAAGPAE